VAPSFPSAPIENARQRLVAALNPARIILFGSHVWGTPTADSDLDFLVIVEDSDLLPHKRMHMAYRSLVGIGVPCDVLVQTAAETDRLNKVSTSLVHRILEQGRIIHG
jgi:predicted nucleotidyltransferase